VPLHILLADDSVPAQNMGKKILVDAGYDVLTVSNGLEALRKIADTVPDIAILDIFMPGYTGLEICERLRASTATAALPVILTVGKLEPYRPEDGEHVHSNAVIVKPFAAAELVSAVNSLIGPPETASEAAPEPIPEIVAAPVTDTDVDPLEESQPAEGAPLAFDLHPHASGSSERAPQEDEPLYSYGSPASYEEVLPVAPAGSITYGATPLLEDDLNAPESLVFNPDARHTPFSASATDILPSLSGFPVEIGSTGLAEFAMEPAANRRSEGEEAKHVAFDESPFPEEAAAESDVGSSVTTPDPLADLELPSSENSTLDPLLMTDDFDIPSAKQPVENAASEVDNFPSTALSTPPTASNDEEERRQAFEALFNATDPIPVEDPPSVFAGGTLETLPNIAEHSIGEHYDVTPDSELEPFNSDLRSEYVASEPDPYLMESEEARSEISEIPEHDPLLEDSLDVSWPRPINVQEPVETAEDASQSFESVPLENAGSLATAALPISEPAAVDAPGDLLQDLAAIDPLELEDQAPVEQTDSPEAVPEEREAVLELPTPQTVQAAPEVDRLEPSHWVEPELRQFEPEPEPRSEITEPDFTSSAEAQPETDEAIITSPVVVQQMSETERVQQAVERVFERFKPLLVAAIVRQLEHND
jgi:CheY-like chemotaxis protein